MKPRICILTCLDETMEDMQYLVQVLTKAVPKYKFIVTNKPITYIDKDELIEYLKSN